MSDPNVAPALEDGNENPYIKAVNKRFRLVKKKLQKIEALESKSTDQLNAEQLALLQNKPTLKLLNDELTQLLAAFETVEQQIEAEEKASKNLAAVATPPEEPKAPDTESEPAGDASTAETEKQGETETDNASVAKSEEQQDAGAVDQAVMSDQGQKENAAEFEEKLEQVQKLFRAFSVISQPPQFIKLRSTMSYQNPQIRDDQLQELRQLGCLCLEYPNWTGVVPSWHQDKPGMEHLQKFLAESDEKPNLWNAQEQNLVPFSQTYAELAELLKRVSEVIKSDVWLQSQLIGEQAPAPAPAYTAQQQQQQTQPPQPQQQPEYSGYGSAPSNPFTSGAGAAMMPENFPAAISAVGMNSLNMPDIMGAQDPTQGAMVPPPEMNMAANYGMGGFSMNDVPNMPVANMYMANQGMPMAPSWNPYPGAAHYAGGDRSGHKGRMHRNVPNGNGMNGVDNGNGRPRDGQQRQQRRRAGGPSGKSFGPQGAQNNNSNANMGNGMNGKNNNRQQQPGAQQPPQQPMPQPQQMQPPQSGNGNVG